MGIRTVPHNIGRSGPTVPVRRACALALLASLLCLASSWPAQSQTVQAQDEATVTCSVTPSLWGLGRTGTLEIKIANAQDLYGYQLKLSFDPSRIEVLDADLGREGINLALVGIDDFVVHNTVQDGVISLAVSQVSPSPSVRGDAVLARAQVVARHIGTVHLRFSDLILASGLSSNPLPARASDGLAEVVEQIDYLFFPRVSR